MQCAFCREFIDDDSFYCDMCGEEIKSCPSCKKTGKGKVCTACGTPLTAVKSQTSAPGENGKGAGQQASPHASPHMAANVTVSSDAKGGTYRLPDEKPAVSRIPELRLLNKNINADLKIDDNTILGRETGQYISTFSSFKQVSGKHCRFNYDKIKGWSVTDLGSTNKTRYNNECLVPDNPQFLGDKTYLKIANIEFFVRIIPS